MACLSDSTILTYNEGTLGAIEAIRVCEHLRFCPVCRKTAARYKALEQALSRPPLHEPPARLVPQIMERLYPIVSRTPSIVAVIAASFVFLVCWIYIYFDFSSNSLVQALRLTADGTSGWLAGIVKGITVVYNGAQAAHKACAALLRILLSAPLGAAMAAVLAASILLAAIFLKPLLKRVGAKRT